MKKKLLFFCLLATLCFLIATMAETFPAPNWRVIHTKYATADVVLAGYTVQEFGAKGDGVADDTPAFQYAMNCMSNNGGGTVFVPEGKYRLNGELTVPTSVTLRGEWEKPAKGKPIHGTILMALAGKNSMNGQAFITLPKCSGLKDLAIWYPEQDAKHIVPYPFCINHPARDGVTVENVTLVNPYQGILTGPEAGNWMHFFKNVYGTPLAVGLEIEHVGDCGRLENVNFSPDLWSDSGLPNAPALNGPHAKWMLANGVGIRLRRTDGEYGAFCTITGYKNGIEFAIGKRGTPSGDFYGLTVSNCVNALVIIDSSPGIGTSFTECVFDGIENGITTLPSYGSGIVFHSCTFRGGKRSAELGGDDVSRLIFQCCAFSGEVARYSGNMSLVGCSFTAAGPAHITLGADANAIVIAGSTFNGTPRIVKHSQSGNVTISHEPIPVVALPKVVLSDKTRKPPKTELYIATDAAWGAKKDAITDDTEAIQKTLAAAAKNGGGIVFLPGGEYVVKGNLIVPPNVEFRGVYEVPHHTSGKGSVLRLFAGRNDENAKPAIIMEKNSLMRGLTFMYPEQQATNIVPYPYTIQGRGENISVINVSTLNSYKMLDFMSYRCDGHFIDFPGMAGLRVGIAVGGGSVGGEVRNAHINQHYWAHSPYPENKVPVRKGWTAIATFNREHLESYVFGDCSNELMVNSMVCEARYGLHFISQNGKGAAAVILGQTCDVTGIPACFEASGGVGIDLINAAFSCIKNSDMKSFILDKGFTSQVRIFNAVFWGDNTNSGEVRGGTLRLEAANFVQYGTLLVDGGKLALINNYRAVNRAGAEVITLTNGGEARLFGCISPFGIQHSAPVAADFSEQCGARIYSVPDHAKEIGTILGKKQQRKGVSLIEKDTEGVNLPTQREGRAAWQGTKLYPGPLNQNPKAVYYMRFTVDHPLFKQGATPNVTIAIDYFDEGKGSGRVRYDSSDEKVHVAGYGAGAYKNAEPMVYTDSKTWKTYQVTVSDALFIGRCNKADLRLEFPAKIQPVIAQLKITRVD